MKLARTFAFTLAAVTCAAPAIAKGKIGFDIGVNVSSLSYENPDAVPIRDWDRHWRALPSLGLSFEVPGNGPIGWVTGIRYVQHGNRVEVPGSALVREISFVHHYLALPMLVSWRPFPSRHLFVAGGPEVALLFDAEVVTQYISPGRARSSQQIGDDMEPFNLSLDAQAGMEIPLGKELVAVTVRYTHGLTGVAKEESWASDWSTRGVEGLIGLRW